MDDAVRGSAARDHDGDGGVAVRAGGERDGEPESCAAAGVGGGDGVVFRDAGDFLGACESDGCGGQSQLRDVRGTSGAGGISGIVSVVFGGAEGGGGGGEACGISYIEGDWLWFFTFVFHRRHTRNLALVSHFCFSVDCFAFAADNQLLSTYVPCRVNAAADAESSCGFRMTVLRNKHRL